MTDQPRKCDACGHEVKKLLGIFGWIHRFPREHDKKCGCKIAKPK